MTTGQTASLRILRVRDDRASNTTDAELLLPDGRNLWLADIGLAGERAADGALARPRWGCASLPDEELAPFHAEIREVIFRILRGDR